MKLLLIVPHVLQLLPCMHRHRQTCQDSSLAACQVSSLLLSCQDSSLHASGSSQLASPAFLLLEQQLSVLLLLLSQDCNG